MDWTNEANGSCNCLNYWRNLDCIHAVTSSSASGEKKNPWLWWRPQWTPMWAYWEWWFGSISRLHAQNTLRPFSWYRYLWQASLPIEKICCMFVHNIIIMWYYHCQSLIWNSKVFIIEYVKYRDASGAVALHYWFPLAHWTNAECGSYLDGSVSWNCVMVPVTNQDVHC